MKPSEIRAELLEVHAALHARMAETREAATRAQHDPSTCGALRGSLTRLTDAARRHHLREEELMREVFPRLEAWGKSLVEGLIDEHAAEHAHLYEALLTLSAHDSGSAEDAAECARAVLATLGVLDRIAVHMTREEESLLGEDVLVDERVRP
jgi:hemerythrin